MWAYITQSASLVCEPRRAARHPTARRLSPAWYKRPSMTLRYAHVGDSETEEAAQRIGEAIAHALKTK